MIIAIDYDRTYTLDKDTWDKVIEVLKEADAIIYCVTARSAYDTSGIDRIKERVHDVFFTNGYSKRDYMKGKGYHIDVWIDDMPESIIKTL